jgi:hypothetical protein
MDITSTAQPRRWGVGLSFVVLGLLVPAASSSLRDDMALSLATAVLAVALLSIGVHRLVWVRPAPFPTWQRVFISIVIGTLGFCLAWVMPARLIGLLGGPLRP